MGIYLSTPKTEKFSEDGENGRVRYGLSSMQGWRATMEDAVSKKNLALPIRSYFEKISTSLYIFRTLLFYVFHFCLACCR